MATQERPWWQSAVVYQIYPRSFQDSNGDGVGDLAGIAQRADYLQWLGVDAVWISPFYPSPMADFGYDVADYTGIDPIFGTLADFDRLVAALHERNIKVILDFVPNHSSSEHPWFKEARSSRSSPKRDWYIWRDPRPDGSPPNNWMSLATGRNAWEFDKDSGQYYYHAFLVEQPDLNWRNPAVRKAMYDALRFWLKRGVDGFRFDILWHLAKDPEFRDNPSNPDYNPANDPPYRVFIQKYNADGPGILDIVREIRTVLEEFPGDRPLIGELYLPQARRPQFGCRPHALQLLDAVGLLAAREVEGRADRAPDPRVRGGAPARRLAELGAGQPRSAAGGDAPRPGPGARGHGPAADPARHAHALLCRRARP